MNATTPKVVARFAYYVEADGIPGWEPIASYMVDESNVPALPVGGNVGADQLLAAGVAIPITPTHRTWVNLGRPIYRGQNRHAHRYLPDINGKGVCNCGAVRL